MEKVVVLGYGGHAKSVVDCVLEAGEFEIAGYTDVEDKKVAGIKFLGRDDRLEEIFRGGIKKAVIGIGYMGNSSARDKLYNRAKEIGFEFPVIKDSSAVVAEDVIIGEGSFVGKRAVVNAGASVGKMCIINTGCIVEHEDVIDDFTHVAVGAVLCGNVSVGNHSFIGANATIVQGVRVGSNVMIGAGAVVIGSVEDGLKVAGVPARGIN